tara:strand:+ start:751 stop:1452 length:702 start_codon:yes stop_codon:yes gene_type:complete
LKNFFVHFGAGAGDLDERSNCRCGFTELIKQKCEQTDKAFVIEANPKNIDKLKSCYQNYKNVEVVNIAITHESSKEYEFFYTEDDAPHYHVCSIDINHVKKHYPNSSIDSFKVKAINVNEFIENYIGNRIDYLSIDLEGIDYSVLMKIDLSKVTIENISIEHLHLSKNQKKNMVKHLNNYGYSYFGNGYDHNNFDYLFKKKKILWNRFVAKFLWLVDHKKLKYFNKLILKDGI